MKIDVFAQNKYLDYFTEYETIKLDYYQDAHNSRNKNKTTDSVKELNADWLFVCLSFGSHYTGLNKMIHVDFLVHYFIFVLLHINATALRSRFKDIKNTEIDFDTNLVNLSSFLFWTKPDLIEKNDEKFDEKYNVNEWL